MLTKPDKMKLYTLMSAYPNATALHKKEIASDLVDFDFADVKVANTAFKPMVREAKFDLGELAIVTFLQAKTYGKPYVLIPATVLGRGQLNTVYVNGDKPVAPGAIKRFGVRAYTQTTGVWVRGMLKDLCGLDSNDVTHVTFEDPHLGEYKDPPNVVRAAEGRTLTQMLLDGEIDAAILGNVAPDPALKPLFPDAAAVDRKFAEENGGVPINHMLVIRTEIAKQHPQIVREIYRVFQDAKTASFGDKGTPKLDPLRFGVEANRKSLEIVNRYAVEQKLIPRAFSIDELFDDAMKALGA